MKRLIALILVVFLISCGRFESKNTDLKLSPTVITPLPSWMKCFWDSLDSSSQDCDEYSLAPIYLSISPDKLSKTSGIQEAIDKLDSDGGVINLMGHEYFVEESILLKNNVALINGGIIQRPRKTALLDKPTRQGDRCIEVTNTDGFHVNQKVSVRDLDYRGWNSVNTSIESIKGAKICLTNEMKFRYKRKAVISSDTPALSGINVKNIILNGISIAAIHTNSWLYDFTNAAVHFVGSEDIYIANIAISNWNSDGISIQGGRRAYLLNNRVKGSLGHGIHLGTIFSDGKILLNELEMNLSDGLYYCSGVTETKIIANSMSRNLGFGIGGLGIHGNLNNTIFSNKIHGNRLKGIESSDGNSIYDNFLDQNEKGFFTYLNTGNYYLYSNGWNLQP